VIRNAVLHLNNEQPMLVDLFELPERSDIGLRCTNLRSMNGKRPVFVDEIASIFFFPYLHIRFIEIPPAALRAANLSLADAGGEVDPQPDLVPVGAPVAEAVEEADLEIDEDFLRRIREV
jgi:hypothetical protein